MAEDTISQILAKGIAESRVAKLRQQDMEDIIEEMQAARDQLKANHKDRIHHTLIPFSDYLALKSTGKTKDALLKQLLDDNKDIYDSEATKFDPKIDCTTKIDSKLLADLELEFWRQFYLRYQKYISRFH